MTAQDERAAVVAWLRKWADGAEAETRERLGGDFDCATAFVFRAMAMRIERGDHITPGGDHAKD